VTYVNTAATLNMFYYCNDMLQIKTSYTTIEPDAEFPQEVESSWCSIICSEGQSMSFAINELYENCIVLQGFYTHYFCQW